MVSSEFHYHRSLEGHRDSINVLVFSGDDRYLASAADDGLVQVFDCETWKSIRRLQGVAPARAIVWHPTPNSHNAVLSVGFRNGDVNTVQLKKVSEDLQWLQSMNGPVHCMAINESGNRLAIGFGHRVVMVHQASISTWGEMTYLPRPPPLPIGNIDVVALSLQFLAKEKILLVTYISHGIIAYHADDPSIIMWRIEPRTDICGESDISPQETILESRILALTNLTDGIDWYNMKSRNYVTTTYQDLTQDFNVPVPIVFLDKDTVVVGSGTGRVGIYNMGEKKALQILDHSGQMVQALACMQTNKLSYIASGISEQTDECAIRIWVSERKGIFSRGMDVNPFFKSLKVIYFPLAILFVASAVAGFIPVLKYLESSLSPTYTKLALFFGNGSGITPDNAHWQKSEEENDASANAAVSAWEAQVDGMLESQRNEVLAIAMTASWTTVDIGETHNTLIVPNPTALDVSVIQGSTSHYTQTPTSISSID